MFASSKQVQRYQDRLGLHRPKRRKRALAMVCRAANSVTVEASSKSRVAVESKDSINTAQAGDAVCWSVLGGHDCPCNGRRLHLPHGTCKTDVQFQLGQRAFPCEGGACLHIEDNELRRLILEWWGPDDWRYV